MFLSRARCLFRSFSLGLALLAAAGSALAVPPVVTTQPGVVSATSGQNAAFTVVATGSGAQTYQWRHLGTPITGANTPTLTLANVKMADAGFYDVVVTDGPESTVSQAGRLVVAPVGGYPNTLRLDTSFTPFFENAYGSVEDLSVGPAGEVYVGGIFSMIAGQRRSGVAKFNSALEVDAAFAPVFDGNVNAVLVQPDGKVLAAGAFTKVNGTTCNQIVRLNSDGSVDGSFVPGSGFGGNPVWALARQSDGKILVGGNFYSVGGTSRSNIARLNADGSLDATFGSSSGPNSTVNALALQGDGKVLVGGWFTSVGGTARGYLARLSADGSLDATFAAGSGFNSAVQSLALQADGRVVAGGNFTTFNGTTCNRISRIDSTGALDATLVTGTGFNSDVRAVAVLSDGRIVASGYFSLYNGTAQANLSVLTSTGAIDASFVPGSRPVGTSLALVAQPSGKFVVGGGFSWLGSTACSGLAKFSAIGALESYAAAGFRQWGEVRTAVPVAGGKWVVAGSFTLVNGTVRGNIARLNADGSFDSAFAAAGGFNGTVATLAVQGDGRLLAGGFFGAFNGTSRNQIARLNADGTLDTTFVPGTGFNSAVLTLALQPDGRIVAGGGFTSFNGTGRNYIVRLNADGALDTSFAPGTGFNQSSVQALALEPGGRIVAGGNFTAFNGTARNRIARLNADGSLDLSFNPGTGFDTNWVQALLPVSGGRLVAGGYFYNFNGTSRNQIARLGGDGSVDTTFNPGTGFDSWVHGLTPQTDERIVASGYFATFNGTARSFLARLQTDGTLDSALTAFDLTSAVLYGTAYADDGRLLVVGSRAARGATVQPVLVMLKPDLSPAANIVTPPVTQSANPGDTVTFTVGALGDGVLSYQWFKNGVAIVGATGSSLVLTNVQAADVASYTVTVSNSLGSATSSPVTLHGPHPAPTITQQPGVVTTTSGSTATFTVGATGTGTLTYQWRRFGVPIPGATGATLTLATVGRADAGPYDVVVADGLSLASSQPGWLRFPAGLLWGAGSSTALGIGVTGRRDTPQVIADGVAQAVAGFDVTFFLKIDGTLWATGANYYGGLGDGTTVARSIPVQIATDVAQVAAGFSHTLLLKHDGSLWAVGYNATGQLGNNSTTDSLTPVFVATGVAKISAGFQHSAFLKDDGSLWIFGDNGGGQLGDGTSTGRRVPVFVTGGVKQVVAGAFCTVFVRTDGSLYGMGEWSYNTPTLLDTGVASVAAGSWYLLYTKTDGSLWYRNGVSNTNASAFLDTGVAAIALSGWTGGSAYLKTDGTMFAYGLGGSSVPPAGPGTLVASGVASIASGTSHILFTKPDHTLWSFGSYSVGQLGDGAATVQSTPALVTDQVVAAAAAGGNHVLSLKADGTLWGSGTNNWGQVGDGTTTFRSTPVLCASGVAAVAAGGNHTLCIDTTGALWAMGYNGSGQLGDGTKTDRSIRVPVANNVVAVAAGYSHSLFLKADGSLWAMGANDSGQLGDGTTSGRSSPVPVASGVVAVAAGNYFSLFLKADGTLWAMGDNYSGQLGDGTTTNRRVPVPVASDVAAIAAGSAHSLFRKTDGTLWATGSNTSGQFGDGTEVSHTTPVQIAADFVAFAAGGYSSLFLKADGTLWAAGANVSGQLGDGTATDRSTPVQIGSGITGIAEGGSVSLFIQKPGFGTGPMITTPPQSRLVAAGSTYVLAAAATGTAPVGYQWYKDGVALLGERSPTLAIVYATPTDAGAYTVAVTNVAGTVTSSPATLTIGAAPAISPADLTVAPGATANFSAAATGTGVLRYQWFKDGVALAGQTGATLSLANVQRGDVGYYRVAVTDDYASTITADASLNLPSFPIAAAATDQLALGAAFDGTNYLVAIQGDASNGTATTAQLVGPDGTLVGSRISVGRNGGEAGVGMGGVKAAFDGTNYLLVWADNAVASTTRLYGVFISKAGALVGSPFAFPVAAGASAYQRPQGIAFDGSRYLVAYSDGTDKPWKLCGRFVTPAGMVGSEMVFTTDMVDSFQSVAANNGQFLVAWPARIDSSRYIVRGRLVSDAGVVSSFLTIGSAVSPSYNPLGVAGNGTDYLVVWNHDTGPGYPSPTEWELRSRIVHSNGTMSAAPVQLCSAATNPVIPVVAFDGSSFLVAWTQLTLGGTYPNVTSTPEDMSLAGGMDLAGRYLAGDGTPSGPVFNLVVGAGNQGLAPLAVGGGQCLVAYNALGAPTDGHGANAVRGILLANLTPPAISLQPVSQNFAAGSTATFTVTAAGSDLTYQWSRDGVDIPGARSATLTVANVQPASFGNYTVTVSNPTGSVTSAPALLGVVGVAGARYRLLDYFYPLVVGNEWLYAGPGYGPTKTHTRRRLVDLDRAITCYTGGAAATPIARRAVATVSEFGVASAGGFTPAEEWTDYFACNGVSFGFFGDDEAGPYSFRTDGGLSFAPTLAVGESFVAAGDAYGDGVWNGRMVMAIRILGIETVTVPAGTYPNCLHLRYSFAGAGTDELNDEWWYPGVGSVKHQDRDPGEPIYERNLLSFTVAQPVLPVLTAQPAGATIALGATASFGVTANGTAPLSYQWYRGESGDTASPIVGAATANFTTPALTAWARYWVRVANRSSYADSATALVEVTGGTMTVGDWAAQGGVPANQRGALATPAGDGVTNLMKFALGVPPLESATAHLPTATTYTQAGQPLAIALLFTQNLGAQGIDYVLEVSDNMVTWTEVARVIDVLGTNADGTQLVRMREAVPPVAVRRFARLKVKIVP